MRKAVAGILTVIAVLVSAAAAFAQEKLTSVYGLSIPDRVGSLVYARTVDFESRTPGLGYALRFGGQPGWLVDVYLYDLGLKTIPADAESEVIRSQLAQARGDVFELGKRGTYADVTDKGDFTVPATGKPRRPQGRGPERWVRGLHEALGRLRGRGQGRRLTDGRCFPSGGAVTE